MTSTSGAIRMTAASAIALIVCPAYAIGAVTGCRDDMTKPFERCRVGHPESCPGGPTAYLHSPPFRLEATTRPVTRSAAVDGASPADSIWRSERRVRSIVPPSLVGGW